MVFWKKKQKSNRFFLPPFRLISTWNIYIYEVAATVSKKVELWLKKRI